MSGSGRGTPTMSRTRWNSRASSWASFPLGGHRPRQASLLGPVAVGPHPRDAYPTGPGNGPVAEALLVLQAKNFTDLSHQELFGHRGKVSPRWAPLPGRRATDERSGSAPAITMPEPVITMERNT
jgi:hypothetical protein